MSPGRAPIDNDASAGPCDKAADRLPTGVDETSTITSSASASSGKGAGAADRGRL